MFPRDKYCGDAVCKTGIEILHEMGLFHELVDNNKAHVVSCHNSNIIFHISLHMHTCVSILYLRMYACGIPSTVYFYTVIATI